MDDSENSNDKSNKSKTAQKKNKNIFKAMFLKINILQFEKEKSLEDKKSAKHNYELIKRNKNHLPLTLKLLYNVRGVL